MRHPAPVPRRLLRDWLASGQSAWLHLRGNSMRPLLGDGSRILISAVDPFAIRPGDLVVYIAGESLACHRVLWRHRRRARLRLLARGDARAASHDWIGARSVLGRVTAIDRDGDVTSLETRRERVRALASLVRSLARAGRAACAWRLRIGARRVMAHS